MLVSDAIALVGTDLTEFEFGGSMVYLKNGKCVNEQGTIGGAVLTMNEAVRNCVQHVGIDMAEALRMASLYPAQAIGVDHKLGLIQENMIANLVVFDSDLNIFNTVVNGQITQVYYSIQQPVPVFPTGIKNP